MSERAPAIRIEKLVEHAAFDECVLLQDVVWGYDRTGMMSQKVFVLAAAIGGQVLGAYVDGVLAGYSMSLPGVRNGHAYLHSHHLAVLPQWRNLGVGRRLKLAQREEAVRQGFDLIEWTFDPLEIKNAYLNITRLGAIVRRYRENFYGESNSPLQGGLPTDRIFAEWWIRSRRVERVLRGEVNDMQPLEHVTVPAAIADWKANVADRERARALQHGNAQALQAAFARGLAVVDYQRATNGDGRFVLGVWDEGFTYE